MKKFKIITDSGCDLSYEMIKTLDLGYLGLVCDLDGENIIEDCGKSLSYSDFYDRLSKGSIPKTSQVNPNRFVDEFEKYLIDGYDILYIAFSSMLSGTYNSALIAKDELIDKYPNCNIEIIDTKSASGGHGLLVYTAVQLKLEGKTITEIVDAIEKLKKRLYCYFTVKDLKHLERGGRISSAAAMVGSILNITPILEVKNDGTLDTVGKIRGEKKAIKELINKIDENLGNEELNDIFVTHAHNHKGAEYLCQLLKEKYTPKNLEINYIGLAIGSHTGQGTVGVFFLGKER